LLKRVEKPVVDVPTRPVGPAHVAEYGHVGGSHGTGCYSGGGGGYRNRGSNE